jgi:hypothetical protein
LPPGIDPVTEPFCRLTLRERLLDLGAGLLRQLDSAEAIDAGLLSLLAHIGAALDAIDRLNPPAHRRGGDPKAAERRKRDDDICALAKLLGSGSSIQRQAAHLAGRLARFQAMPNETAPERVLMREIVDNEAGVPSVERIRKILVKQRTPLDDQEPKLSHSSDQPGA